MGVVGVRAGHSVACCCQPVAPIVVGVAKRTVQRVRALQPICAVIRVRVRGAIALDRLDVATAVVVVVLDQPRHCLHIDAV